MINRAFLPMFLAGFASTASAQDIGGSYAVLGTNLDGSAYEGTAQITWTSDVTCAIDWTTGATTSTGICMRDGNAFVAGYVLQDKIGLVIYLVGADGTLTGSWTVDGLNAVGTEVLSPL
jgi:hypothetical protein